MKYVSLDNWDYSDDLEGLLFWVQKLDEILFDYTLDSYKAPALNVPFLCIELLKTIEDVEDEVIDKTNLSHILEELQWSLSSDYATKNIIELEGSYYLGDINDITPKNHKIKIEVLLSEVEPRLYLTKTQELIASAIKHPKEKEVIKNLSRTFITTLRNIGFHNNYIYKALNEYFYNKSKRVTNIDNIFGFFEYFSINNKEFEVIFIASNIFNDIKDSCADFEIDILSTRNKECRDFPKYFSKKRKRDQLFIKVKNVKSLDPHSARETAERRIELLGNLFVLFHHKEKTSWEQDALVIQTDNNNSIVLSPPISPMKRGFDLRPQQAARQLKKVINAFSLQGDSFSKFDRVIDMHRIAVENDVLENQLLNLWTSFETLIPSNPKKSKIQNIVDSLLPFLKVHYIYGLVERLTKDLLNWDKRKLRELVMKLPNEKKYSLVEKVALILSDSDNEAKKEELLREIGNFVLLRNRCYEISELLKQPKNIYNLLKTHEKKSCLAN